MSERMEMGEDEGGLFKFSCSKLLFDQDLAPAEMVDPSLKGTLNVLGSCAKAPSVKRVVLTRSSMAALHLTVGLRLLMWWLMRPDFLIPTFARTCCRRADETPFVLKYQVSKERAKSLGVDYIPVEESIK